MEITTIADVSSVADNLEFAVHDVSGALDASHVAVNHYRIPPGEGLPSGLHAHMDQEEVFVVLAGEATFETTEPPSGSDSRAGTRATSEALDGRVSVSEGQAIRFAPGEFQSGVNASDDTLVVLALGAPRDSEEVRLPLPCPACAHGDLRLDTDGEVTFICPDCGAEHVPAPCPECGSEALGVTLGSAGEPVVGCDGCGAEFDRPPLQD